ncbi:MAG: phage integrase N-terminal SAM-like domain-containing protein [Treponema sp.]|nr:phage integrase N-terminal SAM-like domain-containing protein [Treponema sp.]
MRKIKLRKQLQDNIRDKWNKGYGRPKHEIKNIHNSTPYIHSEKTYKTYKSQVNHFCDWCKETGIKEAGEAFKRIPEYMESLKQDGKSAWTQSTALNALAKAFDCTTRDIDYKLPPRHRSDIKRSREAVTRDEHFDPIKNKDLVRFCEATGLRRRELEALKGGAFHKLENGKYILRVENGKGGKHRDVEILREHREFVMKMCIRAGRTGLVFPKVHDGCDCHHYRGNYAVNFYRRHARSIDEVPRSERYYCRGDMKGKVFDKKAMAIVSENLGHERLCVIALNYLYQE